MAFDLRGLVALLRDKGFDGPWALRIAECGVAGYQCPYGRASPTPGDV